MTHLVHYETPGVRAACALTWNPQGVPDLPRRDSGGEAAFVPTRLTADTRHGRAPDSVASTGAAEVAVHRTRPAPSMNSSASSVGTVRERLSRSATRLPLRST